MGKYGKGVYGGLSSILKDKCRKLAFQQVVPQVVDRENESQIVGDGKEDETMKMLEENQKPMKKENVNVMEEDCVPEGKWEMISEVKKEFEFSERYGNNLKNNFLKSAIWSPDGLCLLVNSQDNCLRMFNFNTNNWTELKRNSNSSLPLLDIIFRYYPFGPVRDMKWYPKMDSNNPSTCFFVVTTPDKPVYVYDAYSTQIKCNLISNNHLNEIRSTYTMSFNHDNLLCCGHDKCLSIFDLHQPQYPIEEKNLKKIMSGTVSSIDFDPSSYNRFAVTTFNGKIGLFSVRDETSFLDELVEDVFVNSRESPTTVKFDLMDSNRLYIGYRKKDYIKVYDIRYFQKEIQQLERKCNGNQRLNFDVTDNRLFSGDNEGNLNIFDVNSFDSYKQSIHPNTVTSIAVHPFEKKLIASTNGKRYFGNENESISNTLKLWKESH